MLFNDQGPTRPTAILAISQPSHALLSGQILGAWAGKLDERVVLAAGQHDIAWLDWETAPSFDAGTGRPHTFRDIGAALHAPMWERGVDRAYAAWGRRVALLVSRHGSTIYQRFNDRHRRATDVGLADDERAAQDYLGRHRSLQDGWARALGLHADTIASDADLIAFADTLSLVLCGALPIPRHLDVAGRRITLSVGADATDTYSLDPWPFLPDALSFEVEARPLPVPGHLPDEPGMRAWLADPARVVARSHLVRR